MWPMLHPAVKFRYNTRFTINEFIKESFIHVHTFSSLADETSLGCTRSIRPLTARVLVHRNAITAASLKPFARSHTSDRFQFNLVFFQNEVILVQLDELDELDSITHA